MSDPEAVEFAGSDEELEKVLLEFARATGGWAARDPRRSGWVVAGGDLLSCNPNCVPWRIEVTRREGRLDLAPRVRSLPWTRAKVTRLAGHRRGQLADYLVTRLRGGGPEKFDRARLAEPFVPFGADAAAVSMSFAWLTACMLGALAVAACAATLASLPLLSLTISEIAARSRAVADAGGVPLPTAAELAATGPWGGALLFALPLAFASTLIHTLALLAGDLWPRAARMAQASFLFQFILLALAFFPFTPLLALPLAFLVPLGTHLGFTLAWGRRRERLREGPPLGRRLLFAGLVLAAAFVASMVPGRSGVDFTDRLALFRDRFLLGTEAGKSAAAFYYRHTLYAADPLKPFYSKDPAIAVRSIRTVHLKSPEHRPFFRALHFTPVADPAAADVVADAGSFRAGDRRRLEVPSEEDLERLKDKLHALAAMSFRGDHLRVVSAYSWQAVGWAGPPFAVAVLLGLLCPGVSLVFRKLPRRAALASIAACFAAASGVILWDAGRHSEGRKQLAELQRDPTLARIRAALVSPSFPLRHAAAYLSFVKPDPGLAEPLLRAADDPDLRVRLWAVAALGRTRDPRALPVLRARLADPEYFVRYRAAEGLGFLRNADAVPDLLGMARRGSWYEGMRALEALRRIRPGEY